MEMNTLVNLRRGCLLGVLVIAAALVGCGGSGGSAATTTSDSTPAVVSAAGTTSQTSETQFPVTGSRRGPPGVITPVGIVQAAPVAVAPVGDPAPVISGAAATTAKVGQAYSFQPSATDTDNAALTFAISGAPKWATFSATTGRLAGTPTSADVGTDQNIIVQVSNSSSTAALAAFSITVAAAGSSTGGATLSWLAPTQNTDGSALADLSGYVIHYGTVSKSYTSSITVSNPGLTTYVVGDLPAGTYYFSMTSTATNGAQSSPSAEASTTIS
jgi:hypothetical protein